MHRSDLFGGGSGPSHHILQSCSSPDGVPAATAPASDPDSGPADDLLELEHVIGYTGHNARTVLAHPTDAGVLLTAMGSLLVVSLVSDPHRQELLRGHDEEISALASSPSGDLIATGQAGSTRAKGSPSPVIVWAYGSPTKARLKLAGLTQGVTLLAFSPDAQFLAGSANDGMLYIWDAATGEVAFCRPYVRRDGASALRFFQWCGVDAGARRRAYRALLCLGADVVAADFAFDAARRQWDVRTAPMAVPATGLQRTYLCSAVTTPETAAGASYLLCGTEVGDLVVYSVGPRVYRASIPVCAGGLLSLLTDAEEPGVVYCGGGDGSVRKLRGADMEWRLDCEAAPLLDGAVISLTADAEGAELIAATRAGSVYRLLRGDLTPVLVSAAHTARVTAVAAGPRAEAFAAASADGALRVWDLCSYGVVSAPRALAAAARGGGGGGGGARAAALSLAWLGGGAVVAGWSGGGVACYDAASGAELWAIATAHRGAVTAVAVQLDAAVAYLLTGSEDGEVRVWSLRTRALMAQFAEHKRGVSAVAVDVALPHRVHSAGLDGTTFTYDLRKEQRVGTHAIRGGGFLSLTQRRDSEHELITGDALGDVLAWDCDARDPVMAARSSSAQQRGGGSGGAPPRVRCVAVSPSGRFLAASGDDGVVKVMDLGDEHWRVVACGHGHSDGVAALAWSCDEKQIISGGVDCSICVWNFYG
ncbi:quinon protein alcohol dehydrogenase-like superfamily [Tribonema minus]|uniref:Quinon protein alcohol dehydrogenase-like superfamily n=1 Tax=Tribonema minus TaxID=303371 RepID=A0A835ZHC1_9STRA|nr:quinon protein alcohol dehydrogenase-like superfamily [Tribonema minus]